MNTKNNSKDKVSISIFETIADTMVLGAKELNKNISNLISTPKLGKNQVTKELQGREQDLIEKRK